MDNHAKVIEAFEYIERKIDSLYPNLRGSRSKWAWSIAKVFSEHILIEFSHENMAAKDSHLVVLSQDGTAWPLDTWEKVIRLIKDENLDPNDKFVRHLRNVFQ